MVKKSQNTNGEYGFQFTLAYLNTIVKEKYLVVVVILKSFGKHYDIKQAENSYGYLAQYLLSALLNDL